MLVGVLGCWVLAGMLMGCAGILLGMLGFSWEGLGY